MLPTKDDRATLYRHTLSERQLCDLELIMNGGFAPLHGFMGEKDYTSVVEHMRLASGALWPIPVVLDIPKKHKDIALGKDILLCDRKGKPLATLHIDSIYMPDKKREALCVYGTTDETHFGVHELIHEVGDTHVGGEVTPIQHPEYFDFLSLRHTPEDLKRHFKDQGITKVVAFQTRNPIHRAHFELIKRAAKDVGAHALIHPVVGTTKTGDIDYATRVRSYLRLHKNYARDFATLSLLPLAMRMAGPREALWHAIIRKNYGATHFIIGRDHAGPGNDKNGKPFYTPYDAQDLVRTHEKELDITIVTSNEMVYSETRERYFPSDEIKNDEPIKSISGTRFREMIRGGEEVPEWFSFPEVVEELKRSVQYRPRQGLTIFFTGLSGSGKSTIAEYLLAKLYEIQDRPVTFLDGDVVRLHLSKGLGFTHEDRNANIERIGFVAGEVVRHGGIAICSAIAPYEESRKKNRDLIGSLGNYVEVYVSTPIAVCKKRDAKGLYEKAEKGLIKGFTGVDDPYEVPTHPEITIDASADDGAESATEEILTFLKEKKYL